jgi:ABC-2 type transport system ATP-binding protein
MSTPIVTVRGVSKQYGQLMAVDDVTLEVQRGEVYGLHGPHRCRQDHTDSAAAANDPWAAWQVEISKQQVSARAVWSQVGYLAQTPSAYPELTVGENLEVVRRL